MGVVEDKYSAKNMEFRKATKKQNVIKSRDSTFLVTEIL
jgi:hypothetical protein